MTSHDEARRLDQLLQSMIDTGLEADSASGLADQADRDTRSLLAAARELRKLFQPPGPSPSFQRNAHIRIMNQLAAGSRRAGKRAPDQVRRRLAIPRAIPALLGVLLVGLLVLTTTVGAAASSALPGDGLYSIKRSLEGVRLSATVDPVLRTTLLAEFSDERLREIEALADSDRDQDLLYAIGEYEESVDALEQRADTSLAASDELALQSRSKHQIEVLQQIMARVPPQAQTALQRVIDRSIRRVEPADGPRPETAASATESVDTDADPLATETGGQGQGNSPSERATRQADREQEQVLHRAQQIARQNDASVDQVLAIFNGECAMDWSCVRKVLRGP